MPPKKCGTCGCKEFAPNVYQPLLCKDCMHNHKAQPPPQFVFQPNKKSPSLPAVVDVHPAWGENSPQPPVVSPQPQPPSSPKSSKSVKDLSPAQKQGLTSRPLPKPPKQQSVSSSVLPKPLPSKPPSISELPINETTVSEKKAPVGKKQSVFASFLKNTEKIVSNSVAKVVSRKEDDEEPVLNIGAPTQLQHEGHVGFTDQGFETRNLPENWQALFNNLNSTLSAMGVEGLTGQEMKLILTGKLLSGSSSEWKAGTKTEDVNSPVESPATPGNNRSSFSSEGRQRRANFAIGRRTVNQPLTTSMIEDAGKSFDEPPELPKQQILPSAKPRASFFPGIELGSKVEHISLPEMPFSDEPLNAQEAHELRRELLDKKQTILRMETEFLSALQNLKSSASLLEGENLELKSRIDSKNQEIVSLRGTVHENKTLIESLEKKLLLAQSEQNRVNQELTQLKTESANILADLQHQYDRKLNSLSDSQSSATEILRASLSLEKQKTKDLEAVQSKLEIEISSLRSQLSTSSHSASEINQVRATYEQQLSSYREHAESQKLTHQTQISQLQSEKRSLEDRVESLEEQLTRSQTSLSDIQRKFQTLEKSHGDLLAKSNQESSKLSSDVQSSAELLRETQSKNVVLQQNFNSLQDRFHLLEQQLSDAERNKELQTSAKDRAVKESERLKALLEQESSSFKSQIDEFQKRIESLEQSKRTLESENRSAQAQIASFSKADQDKNQQVSAFEAQLNQINSQFTQEIQSLQSQLSLSQSTKSTLEQQKRSLEVELQQRIAECKEISEKFQEAQQAISHAQAESEKIRSRLTTDLDSTRKNLELVSQQNSSLSLQVASSQQALADLKSKIESASQIQEQLTQEKLALDQELDSLRKKSSARATELQNKISQTEQLVQKLEEQNQSLQLETSSLKIKLSSNDQLASELTNAKLRFEEELQRLELRTQEQTKTLQSNLAEITSQLESAQIQNNSLTKRLEDIGMQHQLELSSRARHQEQTSELRSQWESLQRTLEQDLASARASLAQETKARFEFEETQKDLRGELDRARDQIKQLQSTLVQEQARKQELEVLSKTLSDQLDAKGSAAARNRLSTMPNAPPAAPAFVPAAPPPPVPPAFSPAGAPPPIPNRPAAPPPPPSASVDTSGSLFDQIRGGTTLKKVTVEEKSSSDDISKHYDDQNVLHILARALIARRQGVDGNETGAVKAEDSDEEWA